MNRLIFSMIAILSLGFANISIAEVSTSPAAETGNIVVYRDKSDHSVSFKVYANTKQLGRVKDGRAISAELPAGTHTLSSNLIGGEPILVTTKAGETVYIHSELVKTRAGKFHTVFRIVTEQVAVTSVPAINGLI